MGLLQSPLSRSGAKRTARRDASFFSGIEAERRLWNRSAVAAVRQSDGAEVHFGTERRLRRDNAEMRKERSKEKPLGVWRIYRIGVPNLPCENANECQLDTRGSIV